MGTWNGRRMKPLMILGPRVPPVATREMSIRALTKPRILAGFSRIFGGFVRAANADDTFSWLIQPRVFFMIRREEQCNL
jgi:hypothetical protein